MQKKNSSEKNKARMANNFQFGEDERNYFKKLNKESRTGKIEIQMEQFWLCALMGIIKDRAIPPKNTKEIIDYFPGRTHNYQDLLRAFVFYRYAIQNEYEAGNKKILKIMNRFFNESSRSKLSERGFFEFNCYASGGFKFIWDNIGKTFDLATFLVKYSILICNDNIK